MSRSPLLRSWSISLRPLWSSLSKSSLISYTFTEEYKQKFSVELLVYFLTDFIHSILISYTPNIEYKQKSSVELLVYFLTDVIHF